MGVTDETSALLKPKEPIEIIRPDEDEETPDSRFGISALSKRNRDIAYNEEIMVEKHIGEFLIKTPESDIISYGFLSRFRSHVDRVTIMAYNLQMTGNLYALDFDGIELPEMFGFDENVIKVPLEISTSCKRFMFSFDIDALEYEADKLTQISVNPNVELLFDIDTDVGKGAITIEKTLDNINTEIFKIEDFCDPELGEISEFRLVLKGLTIRRNSNVRNNIKMRNILHSVLIVLDE